MAGLIMHSTISKNETPSDYQHHLKHEYVHTTFAAMLLLGFMMIVGTVGNCLVFLVYLTKIKPSAIRCFILALSIIDLITCSICIPLDIINLIYNFNFYTLWIVPCKLTTIVTFTAFASGLILICVATERFKKICRPFGQQMTIKTAKIAVFVACTAAALGSLPAFIFYCKDTDTEKEGNVQVNATWNRTEKEHNAIFLLIYGAFKLTVFVTVTTTLAVLYILIWKKVTRFANSRILSIENTSSNKASSSASTQGDKTIEIELSRNDSTTELDSSLPVSPNRIRPTTADIKRDNSKRQTMTHRTTLMLFVITFTFILSYLPHLSLKVVRLVNRDAIEDLTGPALAFYHVVYRSYFINFAVNPLIYSYFDKNVRKLTKNLLGFERCQK